VVSRFAGVARRRRVSAAFLAASERFFALAFRVAAAFLAAADLVDALVANAFTSTNCRLAPGIPGHRSR
jgi:hypothetical protein